MGEADKIQTNKNINKYICIVHWYMLGAIPKQKEIRAGENITWDASLLECSGKMSMRR